uniref:Tc1-like transposase DDE domain-containing protein n=1 Tax=Heliothis virescens TaxID=7102 RepID=A0A2A4J5V2_HELVI
MHYFVTYVLSVTVSFVVGRCFLELFCLISGVIVVTMASSRRHMDLETAARAVALLQEGESQRSVAIRIGVSRRAIRNVWERYQETGSVARRPGTGRTRATTSHEDRYIRLTARRERTVTARTLQTRLRRSTGTRVSDQTIRNRLHEDGQRFRVRAVRLKLTRAHRAASLRFAREHLIWTMENWSTVLFTDECKVKFYSDDKRIRVWRKPGERFTEPCIHGTDRFGGPSVMVWGGISLMGRTELVILEEGSVTAASYVERVIQPHVIPFSQRVGPGFVFMQDNARPHMARVTQRALSEANISVLPWPAKSPDLNPIEHLWDQLKRSLKENYSQLNSQQELINALKLCWKRIPEQNVTHLIESVPDRLRECIQSRGGPTRY